MTNLTQLIPLSLDVGFLGKEHTVDGSEIRRSPVEGTVVEILLSTTGLKNIPGGCLGFLNHQQQVNVNETYKQMEIKSQRVRARNLASLNDSRTLRNSAFNC